MKALVVLTFLALGVAGCQLSTTDVFCQTHTANDFRPSAAVFAVMTAPEKRSNLEVLKDGEKRCGWKP